MQAEFHVIVSVYSFISSDGGEKSSAFYDFFLDSFSCYFFVYGPGSDSFAPAWFGLFIAESKVSRSAKNAGDGKPK